MLVLAEWVIRMNEALKQYIDGLVKGNLVVLFMKGNRERPACGFSKQVVEVLNSLVLDYVTIDVLKNPELREGIKIYSDWPTIPQLYLNGKFIGGCDIVLELYQKSQLQPMLGLKKASDIPFVKISDAALSILQKAQADVPSSENIRLSIGVDFEHALTFDEPHQDDFTIQFDDVNLIIDPYSALRADDLFIDYVEENLDAGFVFSNPNEPPMVNELSVKELKSWRDSGKDAVIIDVRPLDERKLAHMPFAKALIDMSKEEIEALKKDSPIVFHCHHGGRSGNVAESFRLRGFTNVYNLAGGIDAWSKQIDKSIPLY